MAIYLIICLFYELARALMDDVACEFACAVRCAETISANVLKAGSNPSLDKHPIQGRTEIFLVASCYGDQSEALAVWVISLRHCFTLT